MVVHPELVDLRPLLVFEELEGFLVIVECREPGSRPLGRSGLLKLAVRQGHALLGVLGYHHRWSLRL
ncbi:MAG: hypothetical protein ACK56I_28640, partial [bacterium]